MEINKRTSWNKGLHTGIKPWLGKKRSQETIEKIRKAKLKNPTRYWLGKKRGKEFSKNMSIKMKGNVPPNKGKPMSEEQKKKMSISLKGRIPWNKGKKCPQLSGKNNPMYGKTGKLCPSWKGGITLEGKKQRAIFKKEFMPIVFKRDNYICQKCGKTQDLHVHHIKEWLDYPELRFDLDNCQTLCSDCHYEVTFGRKKPKNIKTWGHNLK